MREPNPVATGRQHSGASPNHAATVQSLQRTWQAGAGQVIVTFGAAGNQWDIEQSAQRTIPRP